MQLGINTDYLHSTGSPEKYLRLAAEAGFTHIHWCHQWNTDFLYSSHEIGQIGQWLKTYGLQLQDIHASAGMEKAWYGLDEYIRRSGVELIINRIEMFDRLGGTGGLALHTPCIRRVYKVDNSKFPQYMQTRTRVQMIDYLVCKMCLSISQNLLILCCSQYRAARSKCRPI